MSTLKTKKVQLGDNADPSKNFLIEVPAVADGTLSIKRQDGTNVLSIAANGKAVIPGVVGTVAQVGGIPTGQVVERGSNANGEYVRFADGTQICTGEVTVAAPNTASGSIFLSSVENSITYAATFTGNPGISGAADISTIWYAFGNIGATTARVRVFNSVSSPNTRTVRFVAIGRWF